MVSLIKSSADSGGGQVLSFSGSNINSNETNPVSIMGTGNGVIPQLFITSRATGQQSGPEFNMRKYCSDGTIAVGENMGEIRFLAATGSAPHGFDDPDNYSIGAAIIGEVGTGTWTDGVSSPGRLQFFTTPDGAIAGTEKMRIESDGEITFPNAAFPGLILAFTSLDSTSQSTQNITTSWSQIQHSSDEFGVQFTAPPSGNVVIDFHCQLLFNDVTTAETVYLGLESSSSDSGIAPISGTDKRVFRTDQFNSELLALPISHRWVITGLTPGTSYSRFVITKGDTGNIAKWIWSDQNVTSSEYAGQATLQVTALGTISDGP